MANAISALWNKATPNDVPSYDTLADLLKQAGYSGPATEDYQEVQAWGVDGQTELVGHTRISPAVQSWLDSQGYGIGQQRSGNTWQNAVLDAAGNPVAQNSYSERGIPKVLQYGVPLFLGAVAGGAGLTAMGAGAGGGAGGAASAGGTAGAGIAPMTAAELAGNVSAAFPALTAAELLPAGSLLGGAGLAAGAAGGGSAAGGMGSAGGALGSAGSALGGAAKSIGGSMADMGWGDWAQIAAQLGSSALQSGAASSATDQQAAATAAAIAEQRRQYDTNRQDMEAYRTAGTNALGQLQTAINQPTTAADVMSDPGYQFGLQQGQQAIDRKIAAGGGRVSGQAIKAAARFGTNYATTGFNAADQRRNDRLNRLAALAGIGQTSTSASAAAGSNAANQISGLISRQGDASGAGTMAQGNIWGNAANSIAALYGRNRQPSGNSGNGFVNTPSYMQDPYGYMGP